MKHTIFLKLSLVVAVTVVMGLSVYFTYPTGSKLIKMVSTYTFFPKDGKEIIYSYISDGDIRIADEILQNKYEISRFNPVVIDKQTWEEDPFSDIYWRFNYYNLEPVRNLLFAWVKTGNPVYKNKLIEITESFIDDGVNGPYSWDYHGTAFRAMTLIDIREKLRKKHELPTDLDKKIAGVLKIHGDFLADPAHFEKDYNHGLDQATALYLLAINYPNMEGADSWLKISSERINEMLSGIVDDDGILVENSPYYHLYVLEKFWEIGKYLKQNHLTINGFSDEKINKMVSYVVYVLQPDLTVPTIGASLKAQVNLFGPYKEMVESHPDLLYVLTKGAQGTKPLNLNIRYPDSGQTIMRSGWGEGEGYTNQTQLIFDVGNYRTNHSDLDALSFNLFGNGIALMPDSGLYTYEAGLYRSYFHGTRSHNTVVVDGKDQPQGEKTSGGSGKVYSGSFKEGDGYVYQSGESELYQGVSHQRAITMIEGSTILIFDNLKSSTNHLYEQVFHLFPDAKIDINGLALTANGKDPKQSLTIRQFITDDVELRTAIGKQDPPDGLCSYEYKVAIPCYTISYARKGQSVSYVTAISIGQNAADINYNKENNILTVKTKTGEYSIKVNETQSVERKIDVDKKFKTSQIYSKAQIASSLNVLTDWRIMDESGAGTYGQNVSVNTKDNSLEIVTPSDGSSFEVAKNTNLNLSNQNIYFKIKVDKTSNLDGIDLYLSNANWTKYTAFYVKGSTYDIKRDGEWLQFGVGKGDLRKSELGNWLKSDQTFDWSKIDCIKFSVSSKQSQNVVLNVKDFFLVPDQKEAKAVVVFDDGWSSVLDAATIMTKYDLKGNIAVITNSVGKKSYLKLEDIKTLQNDYGWNMVSHSSLHKDAVQTYVNNNNMTGFDDDISDALQYLIQNNINSAPNWYVYPDGRTDIAVKRIISKYYKFARATIVVPVVFPFAEPNEVGVFSVYSDRAEPIDVHNAVSDAVKYHQTIFLMFHKFSKGSPSTYTEYSLDKFETILKDIKKQGIKVVTLSELDKENGVPETMFVVHDFIPPQFSLDVSVSRISSKTQNVIMDMWNYLKNLRGAF